MCAEFGRALRRTESGKRIDLVSSECFSHAWDCFLKNACSLSTDFLWSAAFWPIPSRRLRIAVAGLYVSWLVVSSQRVHAVQNYDPFRADGKRAGNVAVPRRQRVGVAPASCRRFWRWEGRGADPPETIA